ncbi:MAG: L-2-hydroxyglutarate oxidase [Planctomycetes bacterium]|nr:L-2-hydroxyglutarate oxidase [Planctomycetota bacterium]
MQPVDAPADCDVLVVGGGIVGLATARCLQQRHPAVRVVVAERERTLGAHQTGHNSGVVHSGLYYRPGSAKARTCVRGAARLLELCRERGLPHRVTGKCVVATRDDELPRLADLEQRGRANGVAGLRRLDAGELRELEPHAQGLAALHVPGAAIVDYAAVAAALGDAIARAGGAVRRGLRVLRATADSAGLDVVTSAGSLRCRGMIACAGLWSDRLAAACGIAPGLRIVPFRGDYHRLAPAREHLVRGLVYPVPDPRFPFLGVHLTPLVHGGVECGPNAVLALRRDGYDSRLAWSTRDALSALGWPGTWRLFARYATIGIGELRRSWSRAAFAKALRRLVPELRSADLLPAGCGIRAQALDRAGRLVDDFAFADGPRMVHVLNAPSPAATACLEIAEEIVTRAEAGGLLAP